MTSKAEQSAEALSRAAGGLSSANYSAIIEGFADRGIMDAEPRSNVFTYNAWQALGRQVTKGQKGVKVHTWISCKSKRTDAQPEGSAYKRRRTVAVFHISQTEPKE